MADSADFPDSPDSLLDIEYSRLVHDIAGILDIEAGLQDAMIAGQHGRLAEDVSSLIDVEAGLAAAIVAAAGDALEGAHAAHPSGETAPAAVAQPQARTRIGLAELGQLDLRTRTGSGAVWRVGSLSLPGDPTALAYQEFGRDRGAQGRASAEAVSLRATATEEVRAVLDRYFAWPRAIVHDDSGMPCGVLIPLISDDFLRQRRDPQSGGTAAEPHLMRELAEDGGREPGRPDGVLEADQTDRVFLLAQLVYAVAVLHKLGWVFGDLSFDNIAVALSPPRLMLLDCDGAAPLSDPGRRQASSVNWDPPECPITPVPGRRREVGLQDTVTDVYKLGLAVLRLLTPGDGALSSRSASRLDGELPPEGADLIRRALSPVRVQRPTAKDLYSYLHRFGSSLIARPTVTSAKLVTASVIRGSNARVEWRLQHAANIAVMAGGWRESVDPAAHPDGYSFEPEESGPVSLEIENRFGTVGVDLGYLDVVELPTFSFDLGDLPRPKIGRLPQMDIGPVPHLDLSAVPRPELPSFEEMAAMFRSVSDSYAKQLPGGQ
jgi:hypothetical protein